MEIYLIDNKSIGAPNLADAMRKKGWQVKARQTDIDGRRRIASLEEELEKEIKQSELCIYPKKSWLTNKYDSNRRSFGDSDRLK